MVEKLNKPFWGEKPCGAKVEAGAEEVAHCRRPREARVGGNSDGTQGSLLVACAKTPGGSPASGYFRGLESRGWAGVQAWYSLSWRVELA